MKKQMSWCALSLTISTFIFGCSTKVADFDSLFPQGAAVSGECPAGYAPISLDIPGATPTDFASALAKGNLEYVSSEFYYDLFVGTESRVRVHAKEAQKGAPEWACSTFQSGSLAEDQDITMRLRLPIAGDAASTEKESFYVEATGSYLALSSQPTGVALPGTMDEALKAENLGDSRFYDLGNGAYELRVADEEQFDGGLHAVKSALVRYRLVVKQ